MKQERVELHTHTNLSDMDGVSSAGKLIRRAAELGMKAIAITDHGVVQAFPDAMKTVDAIRREGGDFKAIYGCETYFVNDLAPVVNGVCAEPFDGEFVVFDLETTGFSAHTDRLLRMTAVRVRDAKIAERFDTMVNPGEPIPEHIVRLTGINDELVKDAPDERTALTRFLAFAGDKLLVAHNESFDMSFLHAAAQRANVTVGNPSADTALFAQSLLPALSDSRLESIAKALELDACAGPRVYSDVEMCAKVFRKLLDRLHEQTGCSDISKLNASLSGVGRRRAKRYHQTLLARNATGLKNLYQLVTKSHLDGSCKFPLTPKSELVTHRDGLLLGSGCDQGELFQAIVAAQPWNRLCEIAAFYDFLEIQPICKTLYLLRDGRVQNEEQLRALNRTVVRLGKELGIPVCATGDVHYCEPEDEICRRILLEQKGFRDTDDLPPLHLRSTEEMLAEFAYLGAETAYEIVVENPNRITDQIEPIRPIPEGFFPPQIDNAEERLSALVRQNAKERYGEPLPEPVRVRLEKELSQIAENGYAGIYLTAQMLVSDSLRQGYRVLSRGSVGASLVAHLAGITEVNPLPPHYICPHCRYTEFPADGDVGSGFDLPEKVCPRCGADLERDGQEIPAEGFFGLDGKKVPDIALNLAPAYLPAASALLQSQFGEAHILRPGFVRTVSRRRAVYAVRRYAKTHSLALEHTEILRLADRLTEVKCGTGYHPGGWMVLPADADAEDFTPAQRPETDSRSNVLATHFDFHSLSGLFKQDLLGHTVPAVYRALEDTTGVPVTDVPMCDPAVYSLLTSPKALGVTPEDIDCETGTLGLPELETAFVRQMLAETKPKTFADLMKLSGLSHGTGVWKGNAQELLAEGTCSLSDVIALRDDIMLYLLRQGFPKETAYRVMECVRKGRPLSAELREELLAGGIAERYLNSCEKIRYLFPKAHAAAYMMAAVRLGWYKIQYPAAFYAASLGARFDAATEDELFDVSVLLKGTEAIYRSYAACKGATDNALISERECFYHLAYEAVQRGVSFLPAASGEFPSPGFYVENGAIRISA